MRLLIILTVLLISIPVWAAVDKITVVPPAQTSIAITKPAPTTVDISSTTTPPVTVNTSGYGSTTVTLPMFQEIGPTGYDGRPGIDGYDGRPGDKGDKGDPGSNANVTEPTVMSAFDTANSSSAFSLQADPGQVRTKFILRDGAGNATFWGNSDGTWHGSSTDYLNVLNQIVAVSVVPTIVSVSVSGTYPLIPATATAYDLTLTGNTTFTISTPPRQQESITIYLKQGGTIWTWTFPASVSFGDAPTCAITANKTRIFTLLTRNQGVTWEGSYSYLY